MTPDELSQLVIRLATDLARARGQTVQQLLVGYIRPGQFFSLVAVEPRLLPCGGDSCERSNRRNEPTPP